MANLPDIWRDLDRPFASMGTWRPLLRQLDDFLNESPMFTRFDDVQRSLVPSCDIEESEDHYLLSFDMPGLDRDNIDVQVQGNRLMVSGERKMEREKSEGTARMMERRYGRFERTVSLPEGVKSQEVEAQYVDGVLKVAIPKALEARPHKIKIGESSSNIFSRLAHRIGGSKEGKTIENESSEKTPNQQG